MFVQSPEIPFPTIDDAACIVCGETSVRVVWSENGYQSRACTCGALFTSPRPSCREVDATRDAHPASFYALPAVTKLRWLAQHVSAGRLLEVGAGEGDFLAAAHSFGHSIAAIEAHPDRAARLRQRLGAEVETAFIEQSSWADHSVDVVYHCDLLSHFEDPHRALRKMTRLLRPGGCLFFEVGLMAGVSPFWYRLNGGLGLPDHRWLFSDRALARLLADCELRIEHRVYFSLIPVYVASYLAVHARGMLRRFRGSDFENSSPTMVTTPSTSTERLRRVANHLRYSFTALARCGGPQTAWFIARPAPVRFN